MGTCLCKDRSQQSRHPTSTATTTTTTTTITTATPALTSGAGFEGYGHGTNSVSSSPALVTNRNELAATSVRRNYDDVSELMVNEMLHHGGRYMENQGLLLYSVGDIDSLVLEALTLLRTLVDK